MSCKCKFKKPKIEDLEKLRKYEWNVTLSEKHIPMQVAKLEDCIHTIGGKYGSNDLFVFPRDEEPSLENLSEFNGGVCWGYNVQQHNYWGKYGMDQGTYCAITVAGEQVYEFRCGWDLMPHKIMTVISRLQEHPISFGHIGFEKEIIGRKVYFRDEPGIITNYFKSQGSVIIVPDGIERFKRPCWDKHRLWDDGEIDVKEDILAKSIYWFRD